MKKFLFVMSAICLMVGCSSAQRADEVAANDNPFKPDFYSSRGVASEGRTGCSVGNVIIPSGMNLASAQGGSCFCNEADQLQCNNEGRGVASKKVKGCVVGNQVVLSPGQSVDANDACNICSCEKTGKSQYSLQCSSDMSCGE